MGPLPTSNGLSYILTGIDRFTRWVEALPIVDITAQTVARAFINIWIARFGIPTTVTTDCGSQFESSLWKHFMELLGSSRIRTTSYHPIANGLIERFHRQLKAAIKLQPNPTAWADCLPIILLGIRTTVKQDLGCSPAELVYGTTLRLPGAFFTPASTSATTDITNYVQTLKSIMQKLHAVPPRQSNSRPVYIPPDLSTSTHVFLRYDAVRKPLQPPYTGPYKVITRTSKHFTIDVNGKQEVVSVDRLQPAYLESSLSLPDPCPMLTRQQPTSARTTSVPATSSRKVTINPIPTVITTRSGRQVNLPARLNL